MNSDLLNQDRVLNLAVPTTRRGRLDGVTHSATCASGSMLQALACHKPGLCAQPLEKNAGRFGRTCVLRAHMCRVNDLLTAGHLRRRLSVAVPRHPRVEGVAQPRQGRILDLRATDAGVRLSPSASSDGTYDDGGSPSAKQVTACKPAKWHVHSIPPHGTEHISKHIFESIQ